MKISETILNGWSRVVLKQYISILIIVPLIAILLLFYIAQNLTMNTDTRDMLSEELSWRQLDMQYENLFPHVVDTLVLVIEAKTPDEAEDSAIKLERKLKQNQALFKTIFYLKGEEFIRDSALLYMDTEELYEFSDNMARYQPFLARLLADQS